MSKGSKQRPRQISQAEYDNNWALIYNKRAINKYKEVDALKLNTIEYGQYETIPEENKAFWNNPSK